MIGCGRGGGAPFNRWKVLGGVDFVDLADMATKVIFAGHYGVAVFEGAGNSLGVDLVLGHHVAAEVVSTFEN